MIRIGIIGTGGMAGAHAKSFTGNKHVKVVACADIAKERGHAFASKWNIPTTYVDYHEMLRMEDLDGVANVTSDNVHKKICVDVLRAGINVFSEKPMATSLSEAKQMMVAAKKAKKINMINFSYREMAGLAGAAEAVRRGELGRVIHIEASYLQSWLTANYWGNWKKIDTWLWRLSTKHGSLGVLGDVGCHIYDTVTWICGDITEIDCRLKTFKKDVPGQRVGNYRLDANDSFVTTAHFKNGALGTIHSSRWATGHANTIKMQVYGDKGAINFDSNKGWHIFEMVKGKKNRDKRIWKTIEPRPVKSNYDKFVDAIRFGHDCESDFANGIKNQAYMHYSFISNKLRRPVKIQT